MESLDGYAKNVSVRYTNERPIHLYASSTSVGIEYDGNGYTSWKFVVVYI